MTAFDIGCSGNLALLLSGKLLEAYFAHGECSATPVITSTETMLLLGDTLLVAVQCQ
jgi:hypothetical protein